MGNALIVGIGGFVGAITRYWLGGLVAHMTNHHWFPYGTMTVNVLGCFLIGIVSGLAETKSMITPELRLFLMVGLLGGFTTFSSFGHETVLMLRHSQFLGAMLNVVIKIVLGLGCGLDRFSLD